jgi:hypothetical protein
MAWCPWLFLLDAQLLTLCLQDSAFVSNEDYIDFLGTLSQSMAKKINEQETYLKVFVFLGGLSRTI